MIPEFKSLTEKELNLVIDSPALVTLLIAGAEGKIDDKEIAWGSYVIHFRVSDKDSVSLNRLYKEIDKSFDESIKQYLKSMPEDAQERNSLISEKLTGLGEILDKIDKKLAVDFYNGLRSLARQVAKASGGIWGYGSISPEEQRYLDLDMINFSAKED